jgi:general secretion pathway protein G
MKLGGRAYASQKSFVFLNEHSRFPESRIHEKSPANPNVSQTGAGSYSGRVDRTGKERELRRDLWGMRDAIDHYKDAADKGAFQTKLDSQNYPPDLETLVKGVDVQGKKVRFLRSIPVDPMTGRAEWGMHSMQDDPKSDSYGGQSLFDVYSKSQGTALDGTKYSDW